MVMRRGRWADVSASHSSPPDSADSGGQEVQFPVFLDIANLQKYIVIDTISRKYFPLSSTFQRILVVNGSGNILRPCLPLRSRTVLCQKATWFEALQSTSTRAYWMASDW